MTILFFLRLDDYPNVLNRYFEHCTYQVPYWGLFLVRQMEAPYSISVKSRWWPLRLANGDLLQDVGAVFAPDVLPGLADGDLPQADVGLLDFPTRPDDSLDSRPVLDQIDSMFEEDNTQDLASILGSVGPARKEAAKMFRQLLVLEKKEAIRIDQDPEDFYGTTTVTRL